MLVAAMFVCLTTVSVWASENGADVYGLNLGVQQAQDVAAAEPVTVLENEEGFGSRFEMKVQNVTSSSAVLSWNGEENYISYSLLKYNIVTKQWKKYLSTTEKTAELTGLSEDTEYSFRLASAAGEILAEVEFSTAVAPPVLSVTDRSSTSVELSVEASVRASEVIIYRSEDNESFEEIGAAENGTFTDTGLKEATAYYYKAVSTVKKENKNSVSGEAVKATTLKSFGLPAVSGACKTCAYYTAVTAKGSPQYRLLNSSDCYTDEETGIRMVDGCYCVALGSYYGTKIGTKYKITLDSGKEFNVILCDGKSNRHTDANNQYAVVNNDVLEFYVEKRKIPSGIRGDYGRLEQFRGAITAIEQYVED